MNENQKTYRVLNSVGVANLTAGIVTVTLGVAVGVLCIVNGARLLKRKSSVMI